jgi:tetratricopeptide (TPR) repeat protein
VDEAIAVLREAIKLKPDDGFTHGALNAVYNRKAANDLHNNRKGDWDGSKYDWEGAIVAGREALRLNPNLDQARENLRWSLNRHGDNLWEKGDRAGAHAAYREARGLLEDLRRRAPNDLGPVYALVCDLVTCPDVRLRDPGRAVELSREGVERWPDSPGHWHVHGIALYQAGRVLEAIPALERGAQIKKGEFCDVEYFHLALAYRQLGDLYRSTLYYVAGVRSLEQHGQWSGDFFRLRADTAAQIGITDGPRSPRAADRGP